MKKSFDLILSLSSFIIFLPIIIIISISILLIDGYPILFIQPRLGKNKKHFNIIKFRTMKIGVSKSSCNDEKRQTILGKFLRKSSLDELPVLVNVIKGDMSMVGPRPLLVKYSNRFNSSQDRRHNILPGITGLAQIRGRNQISWEEKFNYDIEYVNQQNLLLDIKILIKTVGSVLFLRDTSPKNQDIMPEFMGSKKNDNN